jgi:hypothetical protein
MLLLVLYHSARCKNFKTFYNNGIVLGVLRAYFPGALGDERCITLSTGVWALLARFVASRRGHQGNLYAIDRTPLAVGHQRRDCQAQGIGRADRAGQAQQGLVLGLEAASGVQPSAPARGPQADPSYSVSLIGRRYPASVK